MSKDSLFKEFDAVSVKAWKQQIQVDLKGADYNDTLVWDSPDGIKVKPMYHSDDLDNNDPLQITNVPHWYIGQHIYAGDAEKANKKAQNVLNRGAESIVFSIPSKSIQIETLLNGIDLTATPIYFELQFLSTDFINHIKDFVTGKSANFYLNIDIIGNLARSGNWFQSMDKDHMILNQVMAPNESTKGIHILSVDLSLYQNAGASRVQQLAYAMAHANEYLNHLKNNNLNSSKGITFKVSVDGNYFFEISKLRALRQLWATLATAYGINADCNIIAVPTRRNKTLYDYNVNLLRTTTECMSAVFGGANTVCNMAYDSVYHKDNEFGERIARNQLLILKRESYLDKVINPANGSYYIESITQQLAEKALVLFKNIEAGGGFLKQLKNHTIQKKIKENAAKELQRFSNSEEILVGSNAYINDSDKMKDELELYPFVKKNPRKTLLEPIVEKRLTEALEQKRLDHE
ncbi:MAG: methylmalonyl-CoA mutase subunit beta [Maribacter sp.]|nr:methylmalonyl-CoA mutase subunit beta [Maribacter sp.]